MNLLPQDEAYSVVSISLTEKGLKSSCISKLGMLPDRSTILRNKHESSTLF